MLQDGMMDYFNNQMRLAGLAGPEGEPIISCQVNLDKNFAFLEVYGTFLARDSIYAIARYMPSPVRLSVCLAVRHTGGSVKDGYS